MCEYLSDCQTAATYTYSEINIHNRTEHVHIQLGFRVLFSVFFDRFQIKKISQKCHVMMFIENPNTYPHNYCEHLCYIQLRQCYSDIVLYLFCYIICDTVICGLCCDTSWRKKE